MLQPWFKSRWEHLVIRVIYKPSKSNFVMITKQGTFYKLYNLSKPDFRLQTLAWHLVKAKVIEIEFARSKTAIENILIL